ncbi:hypothetical protein MLD38_035631 [Melastoma candidum]|uniref:Uncharacterized protein n=1 Tax=Melastoma candidum TaxID=119954 RepID=A0ACB9LHL1_9MYRT|nr:hypothetical protein MLD38_035631 [Melastoma candidum]
METVYRRNQRGHLGATDLFKELLTVHQGSCLISKPRPNVRIIHVFAPEIIKTDVENFWDLVQRITGKPPAAKPYQRKHV